MHKLAILVPNRNRDSDLKKLVPHLHAFLRMHKPQIGYDIYSIEQLDGKDFNIGMLFNVGYDITKKEYDYMVLQGVDLLPVKSYYGFMENPTQLFGKRNDEITHKIPGYFTGATSVTHEHFKLVNGYSNEYWSWGEEDNDFRDRIIKAGLEIQVITEGEFIHIEHENRDLSNIKENNDRYQKMRAGKLDPSKDGLSNLEYKLLTSGRDDAGFFHVLVDI